MIRVQCDCGKNLEIRDAMAGKRAKCPQCNNVISVPNVETQASIPASNVAPAKNRRNETVCPQCGGAVRGLTYTCDFCGATLPRRNDANSKQIPETVDANVATTKAQVGSLASVISAFTNPADPIGALRNKVRQLPDSPDELVSFFAEHIGGIDTDDPMRQLTGPLHQQACEGALSKLRIFSKRDPHLREVVSELQSEYDKRCEGAALREQQRKRTVRNAILGLFILLGAAILFCAIMASITQK